MATVVIKLGSAIVVDEDGEVRRDVLAPLCAQVAARQRAGDRVVLVTSGAIALGMRLMGMAARPSAIDELQAASAVGQGRLYQEYERLLSDGGVRSAQVLLTFFDLSARTHYLNARRTLQRLIEWATVPVINENDTTTTDEISFGDNDFLAAQVAILLKAQQLVMLTDTDGLYTADPRLDSGARLIDEVRDFETLEGLQIGVAATPIGTGGMRSKVVAAEMATAAGIPALIVNGTDSAAVDAVLAGGSAGTRFVPQQGRVSSFKLWLKYAKPTQGRLVVDDGAAAALQERGTSLLPVGITDVAGDFQAGDAVEVAANTPKGAGAHAIGKGIVNYSAEELRSVIGKKTAEIRELLPRASEEAVHRDYFVLE